MKKLYVFLLFCSIVVACVASNIVEAFVEDSELDSKSVSVVVIDLKSGKWLEDYNSKTSLLPASVMKAVTIGTLIRESGIDYVYETNAYFQGEQVDTIFTGKLIVESSGDPSLNSICEPLTADFVAECVAAIKGMGIKKIKGSIEIIENVFDGPSTPPSWDPADMKYGYGTGCYSFNFENNSYLNGQQSYSIKNPKAVFINKLKELLSVVGISFVEMKINHHSGDKMLLVNHKSSTIDEIMRSCMMRSDNLFAEALLKTYALLIDTGKVTTEVATANMKKYWEREGLDILGCKFIDGSGLSRQNRLTASFLATLLAEMSNNVDYVSFFPLAGQDGTLQKFLKDTPLDSYIALKTGSMRKVQCYAGYKLDDDYAPTHVVVVMINDFADRNKVKSNCEKMLLKIFNN